MGALKKVYEKSHLEALKLAFPLHFLPYLKKQAETILTACQARGQTPMKVNHSSKYDFNSPLKALETEQKGKRAQSSSSGKKNRKLNFSDTGSKAEQSAIIESANPILEERCSYSTPMANKDNNLKLNSSGKG